MRERDLTALGELFERYRHQVYRVAMAIVRDPQVAEDILQDCFLKLHVYAHRVDPERPLMPWLYRVTANLSYTYVSRHQKRNTDLDAVAEQLSTSSSNAPDRVTERTELQNSVRAAIETLGTNQRIVVILHYLANMSLQDIADVLGCPVGTVKSRLHYAREKLRHELSALEQLSSEYAHGYV